MNVWAVCFIEIIQRVDLHNNTIPKDKTINTWNCLRCLDLYCHYTSNGHWKALTCSDKFPERHLNYVSYLWIIFTSTEYLLERQMGPGRRDFAVGYILSSSHWGGCRHRNKITVYDFCRFILFLKQTSVRIYPIVYTKCRKCLNGITISIECLKSFYIF